MSREQSEHKYLCAMQKEGMRISNGPNRPTERNVAKVNIAAEAAAAAEEVAVAVAVAAEVAVAAAAAAPRPPPTPGSWVLAVAHKKRPDLSLHRDGHPEAQL